MTVATMTKASTALMKSPYRNLLLLIVKVRLAKLGSPNRAAMRGVMRSLTNAVTTVPKATPITTPTARSTTLPRKRNALNPFMTLSLLTRRNRKYDFPELLGGVESRQSGLDLGERIHAVDHGPQTRIYRFQH